MGWRCGWWLFSDTPSLSLTRCPLNTQDLGIRQFLLTNLQRVPADSNTWSFRVPLENIRDHISQIGDFPYDAEGVPLAPDGKARESRTWEGKTLFVKGSKSK